MKIFVFGQLIGLAVLVTLVTSVVDKPCSYSYECDEGECCLSPAMRKGKRQSNGYCKPRVANDGKCYVNNEKLLPSHEKTLYYDACPCQAGSSCKGMGMFEVPQGEQGKCKTAGTRGFLCNSQKDCFDDECCVSIMKPIGRKRQMSGGVCEKRGLDGDSCLVKVTTAQDMNFACPCTNGLTCKGSGMFEIPLGESGTCTV